ncbi:MAG: prepilin-type N-terminal cleavage/methylation domain-containing protein [Clostridia bacterium]|nr:prepilin-type N-terminal cleavage/methylation domain-containing protein [Clostridia bacterium]
MRNNKGFSLVELIVVIAIMAILAAVAIPTFSSFINKANVASDEDFANGVKYAVNLALTEEGKEAVTVTVEMNSDGQGIKNLSYKLTENGDDVPAITNGAAVEDDKVAELIYATIDNDYKLKTNGVTDVNGVTITKATATNTDDNAEG